MERAIVVKRERNGVINIDGFLEQRKQRQGVPETGELSPSVAEG